MDKVTKKPDRRSRPGASLGPDVLGENLRKIYDEVALGPVPDEFLRLLEAADENLKGSVAGNPSQPAQSE
jgi:Anti-sigma factor NepR